MGPDLLRVQSGMVPSPTQVSQLPVNRARLERDVRSGQGAWKPVQDIGVSPTSPNLHPLCARHEVPPLDGAKILAEGGVLRTLEGFACIAELSSLWC